MYHTPSVRARIQLQRQAKAKRMEQIATFTSRTFALALAFGLWFGTFAAALNQ